MAVNEIITMTDWIDGQEMPSRTGVYRTSTKLLNGAGWGYAFWRDGCWYPYGCWGNHYQRHNFVWGGLSGETRDKKFMVPERE